MNPRLDQAAARKKAGLVIAALALIAFLASRLGIRCPIRTLFGIDCPGCGGTRALAALLHGDVPRAVRENPAALVAGLGTAAYVVAPGRTVRAADTVRAVAASHPGTRWYALHPQATAGIAAALWCVARNWNRAADRGPGRPR